MKTIGLIGGMTWQTTALYYEEINKAVRQRLGGIHSAKILIHSFDMADLVPLFSNNDWDTAAELFSNAGHSLKAGGAEGIVLCANLPHRVADSVEMEVGLPLLHIADFTAAKIVDAGLGRVGLLGTRAVMEQDFYRQRLQERFGLQVVVPEEEFRKAVDDIVFNELSKGIVSKETRDLFHEVCKELIESGGLECMILGCTEIRLVLKDGDLPVPIFETTTLHAKGIAEWVLEDHRNGQAK